jgi:hypothetical protein
MKMVSTYTTTQYKSTRNGGTGEVHRHEGLVELYAPSLQPNDWYLVIVWGVFEDGSEVELSKIIVKR